MIHPEHDTLEGLITYLNYRKDTGHPAARVDPDQEESWARMLKGLIDCHVCGQLRQFCSVPHSIPPKGHIGTHFDAACPGCEQ